MVSIFDKMRMVEHLSLTRRTEEMLQKVKTIFVIITGLLIL